MTPEPNTEFDWTIYADATFAGLSALIPLPIVDWMFEEFFRKRIPKAVARKNRRPLGREVVLVLNSSSGDGCLGGCITLPFTAFWALIKRLSRKIVYILAVKDATDKVSAYWHQAFLMDYMLRAGHLDTWQSAHAARKAMDGVLRKADTSPLTQLAVSIVRSSRHILRSLWKVRRGKEDDMIREQRSQLKRRWEDYAPYLRELAQAYDQAYDFVKNNDPIEKRLLAHEQPLTPVDSDSSQE
jgi:hypothetical protein